MHQILSNKLGTYGVDTEWFRQYLSEHTQQVLIQGVEGTVLESSLKPHSICVYQGCSQSWLHTLLALLQ